MNLSQSVNGGWYGGFIGEGVFSHNVVNRAIRGYFPAESRGATSLNINTAGNQCTSQNLKSISFWLATCFKVIVGFDYLKFKNSEMGLK